MNQWIEVADQSAIAVVRRAAQSLAAHHGWPRLRIDELAIVATEATTNILRYAGKGRVLIDMFPKAGGEQMVLVFTDRGPGISDMDHMFQDGMSSGGSAGLRMMIAFPLSAPPTTSMALEVVSVNSSMLARVPGPADLLEIDATISA